MKEKTILEILDIERIFSIEVDIGSTKAILREECDGIFICELTKEQMLKLAKEIKELGLIMGKAKLQDK
jgi:hypothetical protein